MKIVMTKRQQKILIIAGAFILAVVVFLVFIYIPSNRRLDDLKIQYQTIQSDMEDFKKSVGTGRPLEQSIILFRNNLEALNKKFPDKEEVIIKELSALAKNMNIEITAMNPAAKKPFTTGDGQAPAIKGIDVKVMPISLTIRTSYKKIGEFLKALKENFAVFIEIENVTLSKSSGEKEVNVLNVRLELNTYLMVPKA